LSRTGCAARRSVACFAWISTIVSCRVHRGRRDLGVVAAAAGESPLPDIFAYRDGLMDAHPGLARMGFILCYLGN
jgi:hypothetical protein